MKGSPLQRRELRFLERGLSASPISAPSPTHGGILPVRPAMTCRNAERRFRRTGSATIHFPIRSTSVRCVFTVNGAGQPRRRARGGRRRGRPRYLNRGTDHLRRRWGGRDRDPRCSRDLAQVGETAPVIEKRDGEEHRHHSYCHFLERYMKRMRETGRGMEFAGACDTARIPDRGALIFEAVNTVIA